MSEEITNLEQMLCRIEKSAEDQEKVTLGLIVEGIGSRSFGPLLLLAGVITTSPLTGIPGMPTAMGVLVLVIAGQLLFGRQHFWLPRALLRRSLAGDNVIKAMKWLHRPARGIDRLLRPRLGMFTNRISMHLIAAVCVVIAVSLPMMELVPLTAHSAGVALTAFGLSLIARDGLLALIAFAVTTLTVGSVAYHMIT